MRVSELTREKVVHVTIDLGEGDSIAVSFDRNKVTPAWVELAGARDAEQDALSLPKALADVLVAWDVYQDAEGDFAPTAANIKVLSFPVQRDLLVKIMQAAVPSSEEGNASPVPTSTPPTSSTEPAPTSPNGPGISPLPVPSASPSPT